MQIGQILLKFKILVGGSPFNKCGDNLGVCQAAGGKNQTVYYAGDPLCSNKMYKWKPGMMDWQNCELLHIYFCESIMLKKYLLRLIKAS